MKTRKQILDFLIKQFPNSYISLTTNYNRYVAGNKVIKHNVYIDTYDKFINGSFTSDFKTIKELGNYIQEHFKDKTNE